MTHATTSIASMAPCSGSGMRRYAASGPRVIAALTRPTAPDLTKLLTAWEQWEKGEEMPGKVLANMKTAGLAEILRELRDSGWTPSA